MMIKGGKSCKNTWHTVGVHQEDTDWPFTLLSTLSIPCKGGGVF